MTDTSFYRVDFWKPIGGGRITPCERGDEAQNEMRIICFDTSLASMTIHRQPGQTLQQFHYDLKRIEQLMQAAHRQGQRYRVGVIKQSLEVS